MADDSVILQYIIAAQDQARGLLQQQVTLLGQLASGVNALIAQQSKSAQSAQAAAKAAMSQGDSLDRLIKLYDQLQQANARVTKGFEAMNLSLQQGSKLNQVQVGWLNSLNSAVQQNTSFMGQHGQAWNNLMGQFKMGTTLTPQLVGQFQQLGAAWNTSTQTGNQAAASLQSINGAAVAVSAAIGALAGAALRSLISALGDAAKTASLFQNTFIGLGTIAKSFGQDAGAANIAAMELASDGLMSVRDSAAGLKNLLAAGFGLPEAINLMKGFKDIASFNRQATMEYGYAIVSATEGIKNQNSLLVDNAGLTKNLTIILKEMGLSEQDLSKVQTDVNVRTKLYNGLLKEMGQASGDAAKYADTFSGSQSKLAVNFQLLQAAIGEQLLPVLTIFNKTLADIIGFLRTSDSAWGNSTKYVAIATAAFVAFGAIAVSLVGSIAALTGAVLLLTPALQKLGLTATGVLGTIGTIAAVLAVATTAFIAWKTSTDQAAKATAEQIKQATQQRDLLQEVHDNLIQLKESGAGATQVQEGLNNAFIKLVGTVPGVNKEFKDLDQALGVVNGKLKEFDEVTRKVQLNQVNQQLAKFGSTTESQAKHLEGLVLEIANAERMIKRADPGTMMGQNIIGDMGKSLEQMKETKTELEALMGTRRELMRQSSQISAQDQAAFQLRQKLADQDRQYADITKNQITTQKQYQEAAKKLTEEINLLVSRGMTRDAAMRLPEIVKQAKELVTSAREGVAPMDAFANAIDQRGRALERARRIEQEAIDHTYEFSDRVRALSRAFTDQTKGVDSLAGKNKLLTDVMARMGVTFDSGIDKLRPFQQLMQAIVTESETMADTAIPNFDKLRAALQRLPGGTSPIAELQKKNFEETRQLVTKLIEDQNKLAEKAAAQEIAVREKANARLHSLHVNLLKEQERLEFDSLEKRQRAVQASYEEQLRDIDVFSKEGQQELAELNKWFSIASANVEKEWDQHLTQMAIDTDTFGKQLMRVFQTIPQTIAQAFTGGGGFKGAIDSIISQLGATVGQKIGLKAGQGILNRMSDVFGKLGTFIGQFAGPIGAAVGSMIGPIIGKIAGLFKKPEYKKIMNDVGKEWGGELSQGVAQQIADFAKQNKVSRQIAEALNINTILGDLGGFNTQNYDRVTKQAGQLFDIIAKGGKNAGKATQELGTFFGSMVDYMDRSMHGLADNTMLSFIKRVKESGVAVKEVTDFLSQMADAASESLNKVTAGIVGQAVTNYDKLQTLVDTTLPDLLQKQDELQEKISKEKDPIALNKLNTELQRTQEALRKAFEEADKLSGGLTKFVQDGQEGFDRTGRLIAATFEASIGAGKSFLQSLDAIGPSLDIMVKAAEQFGFTMSESLQHLLGLRDIVNNNRELADSIDGLNGLMKALNNLGAINQATFTDLGATAADMFKKLQDAGVGGDDALKLMQPTLQTLWELQKRFGFTVDEATQKLLDEAEAAGTVGAAHMSAQERMVAGIDKLVDRMERLLKHFGVDFPKDAQEGSDKARTATGEVESAVGDVDDALEDSKSKWREWADTAAEAGQVAYDAMHGVIYGHSPGGLTDMQDRLEQLKKRWHEFGSVAGEGMGDADKYIERLNKVLNDLARAGMSDFDREMDDIDQRRRQSIDQFVKDMQGAAQDLIDIGIAAINQASEIETRQKVWDERNRRITEQAHLYQQYADAVKHAQDELAKFEGTPMQAQLIDLGNAREQAIRAFFEQTYGATQAQLDAGIAAITRLYDESAQKIRDAIEQSIKDTLQGLHQELLLEQTTDPTQKKLIQLQQQKAEETKRFLESMRDASQDQITDGLRTIEELYRLREQKIMSEVDNISQPTTSMQAGPGTLSWMMQEAAARKGASPEEIAQAIEIATRGYTGRGPLVLEIPIGREIHRFIVNSTQEALRNGMYSIEDRSVVERVS